MRATVGLRRLRLPSLFVTISDRTADRAALPLAVVSLVRVEQLSRLLAALVDLFDRSRTLAWRRLFANTDCTTLLGDPHRKRSLES